MKPTQRSAYLSGWGNTFVSEAEPGVLPEGQNSPQKLPKGLYAEQLTGTAFTAPRAENRRTWTYRLRPSVLHTGHFEAWAGNPLYKSAPLGGVPTPPTQMRWDPLVRSQRGQESRDWLESLTTVCLNGDALAQQGCAVHLYAARKSMENRFFYSADGELLMVPQEGKLEIRTELGVLEVSPGEIALIPRGIKFQVRISGSLASGYVCENYGRALRLPELGPIGANGLAQARDFLTPPAQFEDRKGEFEVVALFRGALWTSRIGHSPLDVVAWHGNDVPVVYDLARFNTIGTVSFDHPDPSLFTVLTSPSGDPGVANLDFVIFPPRWMVAENTFRPPYFHRNIMSEFMGLITGVYDAKQDGFVPGGSSLHNAMIGHGPDLATFKAASSAELKPAYLAATLAFMFESRYSFAVTEFALKGGLLQQDYLDCWRGLG